MIDNGNEKVAKQAIEKLDRRLSRALARLGTVRRDKANTSAPPSPNVAADRAKSSKDRASSQSLYAILAKGLRDDLEALRTSFANLVSSIDQDFAKDTRGHIRTPSLPRHDSAASERRRIGKGDYVQERVWRP